MNSILKKSLTGLLGAGAVGGTSYGFGRKKGMTVGADRMGDVMSSQFKTMNARENLAIRKQFNDFNREENRAMRDKFRMVNQQENEAIFNQAYEQGANAALGMNLNKTAGFSGVGRSIAKGVFGNNGGNALANSFSSLKSLPKIISKMRNSNREGLKNMAREAVTETGIKVKDKSKAALLNVADSGKSLASVPGLSRNLDIARSAEGFANADTIRAARKLTTQSSDELTSAAKDSRLALASILGVGYVGNKLLG